MEAPESELTLAKRWAVCWMFGLKMFESGRTAEDDGGSRGEGIVAELGWIAFAWSGSSLLVLSLDVEPRPNQSSEELFFWVE